jgi:hypothetical protein
MVRHANAQMPEINKKEKKNIRKSSIEDFGAIAEETSRYCE